MRSQVFIVRGVPSPMSDSLKNTSPTDERSQRINHQLAHFIRWRTRFHHSSGFSSPSIVGINSVTVG
jgi:hypothetical protein